MQICFTEKISAAFDDGGTWQSLYLTIAFQVFRAGC